MKVVRIILLAFLLVFLFLAVLTTNSYTSPADGSADPSSVESLFVGDAIIVGQLKHDITAVAVGDINNDGITDIVAGDTVGRVLVWQNPGYPFRGNWSQPVQVGKALGSVQDITLADLDRDGRLDLVVADDHGLGLFHNPAFPFSTKWSETRVITGSYPFWSVAAADLDLDGWVEEKRRENGV